MSSSGCRISRGGGGPNSKVECANLLFCYLANFYRKLHDNKRNWTEKDPPLVTLWDYRANTCDGLFTLPYSDTDSDSNSDCKLNGYTVLCRTFHTARSQIQIQILTSGGSRIPPRWGCQLPGGVPTYDFVKKFANTAWNWKNLDPRGGRASKILLCRSATANYKLQEWDRNLNPDLWM